MSGDAPAAIGIDLGTTYSVVAVCKGKKVEVIANDMGNRTTPSYVTFSSETEKFVGETAKDLGGRNTVFDSKRLIGRMYNDVEKYVVNYPFEVRNDGGVPRYLIESDGLEKMHSPEEVSGLVLSALKKSAEDYLMTKVEKAVITVPAYFSDAQRQATIAAGRLAKLEVIAIINEPTAGCIAYGFEQQAKNKIILIFDLGGGTFDVSVIKVTSNDSYEVLGIGGDVELGGQDFDNFLLSYIIEDIKKTLHVDLRDEDPDVLHNLRSSCETAKRKLSTVPQAKISIMLSRHGSKGYEKTITRAYFEDMCATTFKKTIDILANTLKEIRINKADIDDVVLVGGSTRIPKVRSLLKEFFDGKDLKKGVNPDEAVAVGAAIYAATKTGQRGSTQIKLKDVCALSLGIANFNGMMARLIPRNSPLPASGTKIFTTAHDDQEEAEFQVLQGERAKADDNLSLGILRIDVPPKPKGEVEMKATFNLDENGLLSVTVVETSTGEKIESSFQSESHLSEKEIKRLIEMAETHKEEDEEAKEKAWKQRFEI